MTILLLAWFIIQTIADAGLAIILFHAISMYKIPITIHNIPIILLWIIGLVGIWILSIMHLNLFIIAGSFIGLLIWVVLSEPPSTSFIKKLFICLLSVAVWSQIITVMLFFMIHEEKIDSEDTKFK